jgi:hypothetical protein
MMNLENFWREAYELFEGINPLICLKKLRKNMKNLRQI